MSPFEPSHEKDKSDEESWYDEPNQIDIKTTPKNKDL